MQERLFSDAYIETHLLFAPFVKQRYVLGNLVHVDGKFFKMMTACVTGIHTAPCMNGYQQLL